MTPEPEWDEPDQWGPRHDPDAEAENRDEAAQAETEPSREVPVHDLTQSQLWAADIYVTEDAYVDVFTGREMDPSELVRVPDPEPELEAEP